jgi:prepilin-type N-terminal cleavage/methylation domain-containing protein
MKEKAFTLIEIIIVLMIVGALAAAALVSFSGTMEKAADEEAKRNIEMILTGVEIYRMNTGGYPKASMVNSVSNINANLHTNLPTGETRKWNYSTEVDSTGQIICVKARRYKNGSETGTCWQRCSNAESLEECDEK